MGDQIISLKQPRYLRREAVVYLRRRHGIIVAESTLKSWACRGRGPAFNKIGRTVLYDRAALDEWVEEKLRTAA